MKLAIIGFGLIGSSIARAEKRRNPDTVLTLVDSDENVGREAQRLGLADRVIAKISDISKDTDIIVLATPVRTMVDLIPECIDACGPQTILTDVGSVKSAVIETAQTERPGFNRFVPAHPMAGSHNSGLHHGRADLLDGRRVIICPYAQTSDAALSQAMQFYTGLGAHVSTLETGEHDSLLALISHLPHALAYAYVHQALEAAQTRQDYAEYSAGSFADITRVVQSDVTMWVDIFLQNKTAVLDGLSRTRQELAHLSELIESEDEGALHTYLSAARSERKRIG